MKKSKLFAALGTLLMVGTLAACGSSGGNKDAAKGTTDTKEDK